MRELSNCTYEITREELNILPDYWKAVREYGPHRPPLGRYRMETLVSAEPLIVTTMVVDVTPSPMHCDPYIVLSRVVIIEPEEANE